MSMLQNIRENIQGTVAKIVVGLIVISFSIFGIQSILLGGGGGGVAEINGEEISPQELQQAVNTTKRRLIAALGDQLDPAMLDDERLKPQALEALIARRLQLQSAGELGMAISEQQIGAVVGSMEQFQVDGVFSPELYKSLLASSGFSPAYYKQSLREDLALNQVRSGIAGSDFATPAELELDARVVGEQRDLRYLTIPLERYRQQREQVTAEQVEAYYAEHRDDFLSPETVKLDYIELTEEDFFQPVDEDELRQAYELERDSATYATENRVSHILFEQAEGEGDEAFQQRIAVARDELGEGADFAEVARKFSDDVGSAGAGGDLGFSSGDAFPEAMEEVIASLDVGQVSLPLKTEAGTHLILVTERKEGKPPSFEEMRPQLEARIQSEEGRVELLRAVETLKDLTFNAEDLDGPAQELQLSVAQSGPVTRSQADGLFSEPALLSAAFSDEVLQEGHNSDVIELAGGRFVVMRVREHRAPEVQPLEAVQSLIEETIVDASARAAVQAEAIRAVLAVRGGAGMEELANRDDFEWQVELGARRDATTLEPLLARRAFELPAPAPGESSVDYVLTTEGDAIVVELFRATAGQYAELSGTEQRGLVQRIATEYGSLVDVEYRAGLREGADVVVM